MSDEQSESLNDHEEEKGEPEFRANGNSVKIVEVEAKLDNGHIEEAESLLLEGLSINSEVNLLLSFGNAANKLYFDMVEIFHNYYTLFLLIYKPHLPFEGTFFSIP